MAPVKAFSIEEELGNDLWEQPPPGDDVAFESGFYEVPRLQKAPSSSSVQSTSATVFTPPRRDLFISPSSRPSSSSSSSSSLRTSNLGPTPTTAPTSSSSSSSTPRPGTGGPSFADRISHWPRGPSIPPRSSSTRSKPPSAGPPPALSSGTRPTLNPYSSHFQRTLPPPTPSSAPAAQSSGHLPARTWTSSSAASIHSIASDPGHYHYFTPSSASLVSSVASTSASSLELPQMRMPSAYAGPDRPSSRQDMSARSDASAPSTPRKRSSSSLFDRPESSSKSIRSIKSNDDYYHAHSYATSSARRGSDGRAGDSPEAEPGLPQGWTGPEPPLDRKESSARWSSSRGSLALPEVDERRVSLDRRGSYNAGQSDRRYVLQVVEQPQHTCAVGFDDADDEPLSPVPILKLSVYDSHQRPVNPRDLDLTQLVVSIDLWSEDGSREKNLLVRPKGGPSPTSQGRLEIRQESISPNSRPAQVPPISRERTPQPQVRSDEPAIPLGWSEVRRSTPPPPRKDWSASNTSLPGIAAFNRTNSISTDSSHLPDAPLSFPSIGDWDRRGSTSSTVSWASTDPTTSSTRESIRESFDSRWSGSETHRQQQDYSSRRSTGFPPMSTVPPSDYYSPSASASSFALPTEALARIRLSSPSISHHAPLPSPTAIHPPPPSHSTFPSLFSMDSRTLPPLGPPSAASKVARVLVGNLVTVGHRLVDDQGQAGVFYFASDVSVRVEGTYRLRFCLMNVDSATHVSPSQILAETFSTPFVVHRESTLPRPLPVSRLARTFMSQGVQFPGRPKISEGIEDELMREESSNY